VGNLLATSAAVTAAIYYTIGRRLRRTLGIWAYVGIVYGAAFLTLLMIALSRGVALSPQSPREIAIFAGLAIGPMLIGHTGMNWALKYLPGVRSEPHRARRARWSDPAGSAHSRDQADPDGQHASGWRHCSGRSSRRCRRDLPPQHLRRLNRRDLTTGTRRGNPSLCVSR
jgi:hypothetical protein